jgi:hypothetical protein
MQIAHPQGLGSIARAAWLLVALLAVALPAQSQWQWRDKSGQVTISDLPPPRDVPDKDILKRPDAVTRKMAAAPPAPLAASSAASAAAAPVRPAGDKELEARKRVAEQEQQAKARADEQKVAAQRADNCRRARAYLTDLQSGQRIARTNEKGEREVLDDKARAEELRRANEVIAADCK